jgi:site-specific DNA recombinase
MTGQRTPPRRRGRAARPTDDTAERTGPCRVAVYIRRSTDDEHQPFSLDAQRAALQRHVNGKDGWTIVAEFEDDASGATTERPGLQKALQAARAGMYDVLLVYRLDRLSRSVANLLALITQLEGAHVRFSSATEPVDTGGPFGRMMLQQLAVFAEFERNIIIDRVKSGMAAKAGKGKWAGGTRPYGYNVDPDTHRLVVNPDEAPILRDVFRLYTEQRLGTRAIAQTLNARGVRSRTGKPWSGQNVNRILDNPAYTGDIAYGDVLVPDAHEPLIDRSTFAAAQKIIEARGDAQTQRAMSDSDYFLTGLLICPDCGQRYIGTSANGRTRRYRYYTYFTQTRYGKASPCKAPRLNADELDTLILAELNTFYARADTILIAVIRDALTHHAGTDADRHAELAAVAAQITTTENAINRYHTAFESGAMNDTTAGPRIRDLRQQAAQLHARHAQLQADIAAEPAPPEPDTLAHVRRYLHKVMASGSTAARKAAIETLIAEVQLTEQGAIPMFKIPHETTLPPSDPDGGNIEEGSPVRTMVRSVGRAGLEPATEGL